MSKIVICGATSAIAMETAKIYAARGSEFFLIARNGSKLATIADDLRVRGANKVETAIADLTDFSCHQKLIDQAASALPDFDIFLIAHGTLGDQSECERDFSLAEKELNSNFLSKASLLTIVANRFESAKKGTIAVITSVAGDRGRKSNYIYGTAKGATNIFLQGLRNRLYSSGVNVITIKPGFVDTPMTASIKKSPLFAQPQAIAQGIVRAIDRRKDVVYLPWFWLFIMLIIRHIPERIFKRLSL
jgi:decaprenylphospho-beta-D-erythro-pentofuranosid-2-ulose 2-reductase